jgi:hypothetical protein
VIDAAAHSLQPAKACSCSILRVSRTRHVLRRYLCGSGPQGLAVDGSSIPCVDWHAHNAPLVGAGAGGAPFCLSEEVMAVFAVLFRFKWWSMLRTRPGLVSGGQDTFSPLCGITGEFAGVGDRTAPVATGGRRGRRLHGMDVPAVGGGGRRCARFRNGPTPQRLREPGTVGPVLPWSCSLSGKARVRG